MYHILKIEKGIETRHLSHVSKDLAGAKLVLKAMADGFRKANIASQLHRWALATDGAIYRIEDDVLEAR